MDACGCDAFHLQSDSFYEHRFADRVLSFAGCDTLRFGNIAYMLFSFCCFFKELGLYFAETWLGRYYDRYLRVDLDPSEKNENNVPS